MIIEYSIEPISEVDIEQSSGMPEQMKIDGAEIYFDIDTNQHLKRIRVTISGLPMKWERADLINPNYPETRDKAYRIIKYLVDRIQLQVMHKSFELSKFDNIKIKITTETDEEKDNWSKFRKRIMASLDMPYSILGAADMSNYEGGFKYAQAFSNFTDALNTDSPIIKFERFYKVVETFFTTNGPALDSEISVFMRKHDPKFKPENFKQLRDLRNRCIHPQHRK